MLATDFLGSRYYNPLILASGIMGLSKATLRRAVLGGAGGVTIKSVSWEPREGHHNPTILAWEHGLINAVGYSNPGIEEAKKEFSDLTGIPEPVIGSCVANDAEGFGRIVKEFDSLPFAAIELALSCPHTPGFGLLAGQGTPEATAEITRAAKKATRKPVIVKLSPSVPNLGDVAKAAEKAGADAINMGNTLGPGMIIELNSKKPVLDFKVGGVSGPAIKPIAVRCVYDVYESVKIPIIGLGGVTTGLDAVEMILAGASMVGVGSAVHQRGIDCFYQIATELERWMKFWGYRCINDFKGAAHE